MDCLVTYSFDENMLLSHILTFKGQIYSKDLYWYKNYLNYLNDNTNLFEYDHHIPSTELHSLIGINVYFESKTDAIRAYLMQFDVVQ